MVPDKEWMTIEDRSCETYEKGVDTFLNYAFSKVKTEKIRCPCTKCVNVELCTREEIKVHLVCYGILLCYGILQRYKFWYHHGERLDDQYDNSDDEDNQEGYVNDDEMYDIVRDLYPDVNTFDSINLVNHEEEPNDEAKAFYKLLKDSQEPIYKGSKISIMSTLVKLLHIKTLGRWSNESFTMLLQFMKDELLPDGSKLPNSYYDAKQILRDLGLSYTKIDACVNDCMLFWKDHEELNTCKVCDASRWKSDQRTAENKCKENGKKIPQKTLRYFPLKPRLQRLYMSSKTASLMRWHHEKGNKDGIMRHPRDSIAWKSFDDKHQEFALEPRNVRLGLATDGFQPFANSKTSYSIWPVILIPYNLPPELCMKKSNMILSMLIPGPESPKNAIDIYLSPLIDELKDLWEAGVKTFDASVRCHFQLRATLLWTINDFPAYGMVSGWSTKGKLACPCCLRETHSIRLSHYGKQCYMGHRRFLPHDHKWRKNKDLFDGKFEYGLPPKNYSIEDILDQVQDLENFKLTNSSHKRPKINHGKRGDNWSKKSIFFELPYWRDMMLRHNLDVMHIEKNICDSILGTIMNIKGKTKDTIKTRLDLQAMGLRPTLHLFKENDKTKMPPASYTLSLDEKRKFCQFFKQLKVPDGFSSNISYCVNTKEVKILGLKSHDCHVILQHLLPVAIRGLLTPIVREALIELSMFFSILGAKTLRVDELEQLETQIPITLCKLEKVFPPSFFDIMVHLPIHLANEAKIGGPVQFRWMFPIEQQMYQFKSYIRNRARPEGSIAEGYLADECMTLCSRYLDSIETRFNRLDRNFEVSNDDNGGLAIFNHPGRGLGARSICDIEKYELNQAHIYILKNCDDVQPFLEEYSRIQASDSSQVTEEEWCENFKEWFKDRVTRLFENNKVKEMEDLLSLAYGPKQYVTSFNGYIVNGYRFHIERHEKNMRTQNSGVVVIGNTGLGDENVDYYGILTEILELQYVGGNRIVLFRCKWWDVYDKVRGIKVDEYGFVSVNFSRQLKTNEPFVLASQARQVFYAIDQVHNKGWHVVLKSQPRNSYESSSDKKNDGCDEGEAYQHGELFKPEYISSIGMNDEICERRMDMEPTIVKLPSAKERQEETRKRKRVL